MTAMNIQELAQKLAEEGCNPDSYAIGERGRASDAYCLTQANGMWSVYYTERGVDQSPFFETADETEACDYFFQFIMRFRHDHLVGFFRAETAAQALQAILERYGIPSRQDKIPYGGWHDPRYRVFVSGKAIFAAREILGNVPIHD
jgi:hypothetical protein